MFVSLSRKPYTYFNDWQYDKNILSNGGNNGNVNNGNVNNGNAGNENVNNNGNVNNGNNDPNSVYQDPNNQSSNPQNQGNGGFTPTAVQIVDEIYDSTYRPGTDDERLEMALNAINDDNIIEVMQTWNKTYSSEKGESLMEAFMWDANADQKRKYCSMIEKLLREKTKQLGIEEQCQDDFNIIRNELRSWVYISNDISDNYDNIIRKIINAENGKFASPNSQSNSTTWWESATRGMNFNI